MTGRQRRAVAFGMFVALVAVAAAAASWSADTAVYGVAAFGLLAGKGLLAVTGRAPEPSEDADALVRATALITVYNEDPAMLRRCVESLEAEPNIRRVVLVDDGSTDQACIDAVHEIVYRPGSLAMSFTQPNRGKRHALRTGAGLAMGLDADLDLIVTIDSDSAVRPGSIAAAVAEMRRYPNAVAMTGVVRAHNWRRNILTRMQDVRYAAAFLWERAAYSRFGSVLCVCGAFTVWNAHVFHRLTDQLVKQRFLGVECTFGDDRHLTNLALAEGYETRMAEAAVAETLVPERWAHWIRQQVRWAKSFVRESVWAVGHLPYGRAWLLACVELLSTFVFSAMLAATLLVGPSAVWTRSAVAGLAVWLIVMSWARSVRWFEFRAYEIGFRDVAAVLVISPLYGLVHLALVTPIRLYALATLGRAHWGTRSSVEVAA